jgi:lipopolysaccharide export system permease protein
MLSQLMVLFGFFSLVLILIYWINRAVILFDRLIADGQSAAVFLEFTALSLPGVIRLALPIAAFAAAVYVTNRMSTESELTVVQATGYSPWRLARPVLYFGLIVALMMSLLMHVLVPLSSARLSERQSEIAANLSTRLLTEGQFIEPIDGVTFYIREITPQGELLDIFLSDDRSAREEIMYTAARAFLLRDGETTQLVMINGMVQTLRKEDRRLFTTRFDDFAYNIGSLIEVPTAGGRRDSHLSTLELINPTPEIIAETRKTEAELLSRGHDRINQSLLGIMAALLGYAALMVGGYSRFGVWKQIVGAIFLIIVVKAFESVGLTASRGDAGLWFAAYLPSIAGALIVTGLLIWAAHPDWFRRRKTAEPAT